MNIKIELPEGAVVHMNGIPITLPYLTWVEVSSENVPLLFRDIMSTTGALEGSATPSVNELQTADSKTGAK